MSEAYCANNRILEVLAHCNPAFSWLSKVEPVAASQVPKDLQTQMKQLEKLGLVFRRNRQILHISKQRLKRVLEHESRGLSVKYTTRNYLDGSLVFAETGDCSPSVS